MIFGLPEIEAIATSVAALAAVLTLPLIYKQLRTQSRLSEGDFLLRIEEISQRHDEVHLKLRPGGEWAEHRSGPTNGTEWIQLEDYMGFFEICELLIEKGALREADFKTLFGYRVSNIAHNPVIVQAKLKGEEREYWKRFLSIAARCGNNL